MSNRNAYTVHNEKGWTNRHENSSKTLRYYEISVKAKEAEREKALKNSSEHIIHGFGGKIKNKNSYGNDLCPPRNRK